MNDNENKPQNKWAHDQDISFKKFSSHLLTLKESIQKAIEFERENLSKMVGARDSIKKR
jgi:hypothetical protein